MLSFNVRVYGGLRLSTVVLKDNSALSAIGGSIAMLEESIAANSGAGGDWSSILEHMWPCDSHCSRRVTQGADFDSGFGM
jgi:hypothetical protein